MRRRGIEIGGTIAGRKLEAEIGRGGMGVVFRAHNERLDRTEAVKVIADDLARDRNFRERFLREAMIAIAVEHPHVIPVYDADEGSGGHLFIAMRYVSDGWNLASLIGQRGRLEPRLAAQIVSDVASALDSAHALDLVHRDVKPTNVLIVDQRAHHSYLTDFGLSKQVSSKTSTTAGTVIGTVDYMAPEQAQGREVDHRTDVYALGVTLFEALTGRVPYDNETDEGRLLAKVQEPAPMVTQVAPGIPSAFDAVLARALARDPDERYPSAGELGRAAQAAAGRLSSISIPRAVGVGSVIADCLIEEVAGEGGMAIVYRATQQSLGREVALKLMAPGLADRPEFRSRFEREWKIAAALEHPNVVPVLWAGEHDGRLFIVMRFIAGRTLRERLAEVGRLEPDVAVEVLEQIAGALEAAHARGLVHRDIKPGNVLVDDARGAVFLTDFGLAKELGEDDITDVDDQVMGTARYMPPERHGGGAIDEVRGDIYSLGCLLWDMLAGTERPRLDAIDAVPPALAAVVRRAISDDPDERFGSAAAMAAAARVAVEPNAAVDAEGAGSPREEAAQARAAVPRRRPLEPTPLSSGLAGRVVDLCDTVIGMGVADGEALSELTAVRDRLTAPLRLALAGRAGSGRSTLLSALIGRRLVVDRSLGDVAATAVIVYGHREGVTALTVSGASIEDGLTADGMLPATVVDPGENLDWIEVELPLESLRTVSLAIGRPDQDADATLLVLAADDADDATAVVDECLDADQRRTFSAINCAAVLTKADLAGPDLAGVIAGVRAALGHVTAPVAPLSGLLAAVATTGVPVGDDIAVIGELAGAAEGEGMLASTAAFHAGAAALAPEEREALLARYGLAGLRRAFELAAAGDLTGVGLRRRLREVSGLDGIEQILDGFHRRSDALKADRALDRLEELAYEHAELSPLRDQVEALRLAPEMHLIGLIRAYQRIVVGGLEIPPDLLDGLQRLIIGRSRAERFGVGEDDRTGDVRAAALAGFRAWKMFENAGNTAPSGRRVARLVARSYEEYAREAEAATQ